MPIYSYKCACGNTLNVMHGMTERVTPACDKCGAEMKRDYSFGAIKFKGTGWGKDA